MTGFLDELQAAVTTAAERVGPAVIGLGRGWGRGSGVVIAEGRMLTNAHVLRGDEVAVGRGGGEVVLGRVAGVDDDLDVAVIAADTGDAGRSSGSPAVLDEVSARPAGLRARRPRRTRAAHDVRARHRDGPLASAGRAAAGSAARSSTPRRCRAGRPAARSSTATAACSGSTPCAWTAG